MNNMFWTMYFGKDSDFAKALGWILAALGIMVLVPSIPAFIIETLNEFFIDLWEDMLFVNIGVALIMTAVIVYIELHDAKQENQVYFRGRKSKGKKNKRDAKMVLTLYLITFLVGYPISVAGIELVPLQELHEQFLDLQMADDNFFKSLGYNYLGLLFYYIEHLIYLILIPVIQLLLVNTVKKTRKNLLSRCC
ncbi:hypothetical protein [Niallia taxi]|uniref:hypothetical protein n=1 Tax=Niallia taxi TaxID=2499688 RepID=UPI0015F438AA|nr:hypothetical protein [Niallia taxi]